MIHNWFLTFFLFISLSFGVSVYAQADTADNQLVVVVHQNSALSSVTHSELKRIFTGETVYIGNRKVKSYYSSNPKAADAVFEKVYGLRNKRLLKKNVEEKVVSRHCFCST